MSDVDSDVLEKILDPSTHFIERRRAFDEAMKWARGEGWDACEAAYREAGAGVEAPAKPPDMIVPERAPEEPAEPTVWRIEEVPVIDGHAAVHATLPVAAGDADRKVVRVPVRSRGLSSS